MRNLRRSNSCRLGYSTARDSRRTRLPPRMAHRQRKVTGEEWASETGRERAKVGLLPHDRHASSFWDNTPFKPE